MKRLLWPVLLAAFFAGFYVVQVQHHMMDFEVYRTAATRAANVENLYRLDDGHYTYKYLPAFAFPMAPFARLQDPVARVAWFALSCGLLVALLRWSVRALPERNLTEGALIGITAVLMTKFYARELNLGQTNLLLAGFLVAALLAAQVDARRTAGALVGVGILVKVYAAILLPWLWLAAGPAGLAAAAFVVSIGLLLPATVYGWDGNIQQLSAWYRSVSETTAPNLLYPENISAASMWAKWTGAGPHVTWLALATIVIALVLAGLAVSRRKLFSDPIYLEFGMLMLLVPIISPQGWDYVLLLATPAIVCIVDRWKLVTRPWQVAAGAALATLGLAVDDLLGRRVYDIVMNSGAETIAVLVLVGCLVNIRLRGHA